MPLHVRSRYREPLSRWRPSHHGTTKSSALPHLPDTRKSTVAPQSSVPARHWFPATPPHPASFFVTEYDFTIQRPAPSFPRIPRLPCAEKRKRLKPLEVLRSARHGAQRPPEPPCNPLASHRCLTYLPPARGARLPAVCRLLPLPARPSCARLPLPTSALHTLRPYRTDCFATIRFQPRTTPGIQPLRHEGGRLASGGEPMTDALVFVQQWLSSYD